MSSITRFLKCMENYEAACLSAYRHAYCDATQDTLDDRPSPDVGKYYYTEEDNKKRTRDLSAALLKLGYGIIEIDGTTYTERCRSDDAVEVREEALVVFNINDDHNFYENIYRLSKLYNQDCFLYKEKGSNKRYIIGTNNAKFPGNGSKVATRWVHENIINEIRSRIMNNMDSRKDSSVTNCRDELIDVLGLKYHET